MTSPIRLRQHTDGRLAVCRDGMWLITSVPPVTSYPSWFHDDRLCSGPGWSELLVAELPEPAPIDSEGGSSWIGSDNAQVTLYAVGPERADLVLARQDALKMLAAVAACEQYRAQREATT